MPVVAVNLATNVFGEIQRLVERRLYSTLEQFLEIAAFNQLALEGGSKPEDLIARGHRSAEPGVPSSVDKHDAGATRQRHSRGDGRQTTSVRSARPRKAPGVATKDAQALLSRVALTDGQTYPPPATTGARPPSERLWGQVNRLFPLKFACRWLVSANLGRSVWEAYEVISDRLAEDAASIGSLLEQVDIAHGRKRDELLATGLPRLGHLASRDRFLSQFIARTTRALEIYPGAICQYALATFDGDHLAITDKGLALAKLHSSVLDGDFTRATSTLSDDERSFFVHQVMDYVPGELRDLSAVLRAVVKDQATPDALTRAVRSSLPPEWTDIMVRTHVSGLIARLTEMAVLRRKWEGRNVRYEQGPDVQAFLARVEVIEHGHAD